MLNKGSVGLMLLLLSACGRAPNDTAAIDQALNAESLQATVQMLKGQGVDVNLTPEAAIVEHGDAGSLSVSFPIQGSASDHVAYAIDSQGDVRIVVAQPQPAAVEAGLQLVSCGTYQNADTCDYGPWLSGQGCSGGPLYKYNNCTRKYYQYGRKLSVNYSWYSCNWMAQDRNCTTTCN